ncbi:membrane protein [Bryobacterales bacterium F-183]|nr:membrane protein [Bryobacterales bacterium F-183]
MGLLDRVSTLIRANLNDLIDKAEDPEKMIKQVVLDMQNQLLQLKTQVAMSVADHHLLIKKKQENEALSEDWVRKAQFAVDRQQDDLGRAAIEKSIAFRRAAESFAQQAEDQNVEVANLKEALIKLQVKLAETQAQAEVLVAQHRRARVSKKAAQTRWNVAELDGATTFARMKGKVAQTQATAVGMNQVLQDGTSVEDKLAAFERDEEVERLLAEMRDRKQSKPA